MWSPFDVPAFPRLHAVLSIWLCSAPDLVDVLSTSSTAFFCLGSGSHVVNFILFVFLHVACLRSSSLVR